MATIYKLNRVPGISISKLCKTATILLKVSKYPHGSKWAALSCIYHVTYEEEIEIYAQLWTEMLQRISYTENNLQGSLEAVSLSGFNKMSLTTYP